jgi:hypothetical protein
MHNPQAIAAAAALTPETAWELLRRWYLLNSQRATINASEILCRKELAAFYFPVAREGTNALPLGDGHVLKLVAGYERNVDRDACIATEQAMRDAGIDFDALFVWKPSLAKRVYDKLTDEQRLMVDSVLSIKESSPQLKVVPESDATAPQREAIATDSDNAAQPYRPAQIDNPAAEGDAKPKRKRRTKAEMEAARAAEAAGAVNPAGAIPPPPVIPAAPAAVPPPPPVATIPAPPVPVAPVPPPPSAAINPAAPWGDVGAIPPPPSAAAPVAPVATPSTEAAPVKRGRGRPPGKAAAKKAPAKKSAKRSAK